jgi:hypothetical protein
MPTVTKGLLREIRKSLTVFLHRPSGERESYAVPRDPLRTVQAQGRDGHAREFLREMIVLKVRP